MSTIVEALAHHAENNPGKLFININKPQGSQCLNFGDFYSKSLKFAGFLKSKGVGRGDIVLIVHPMDTLLHIAFAGSMMIGAIPSLMPAENAKQDKQKFYDNHRALYSLIAPSMIVASAEIRDQYRENLPDYGDITHAVDPDDPALDGVALTEPEAVSGSDVAFIQHSSGTTANKKGVMLSHEKVLAQVAIYQDALDMDDNSVIATWLPLYHDMGLITNFMLPLIRGLTVHAMDNFEWVMRPVKLFDMIEREKANYCWLPNFAFSHLAQRARDWKHDLSSMKYWVNCSEVCRPETHAQFVKAFADNGVTEESLKVCYAMAETVFAVSQTPLKTAARSLDLDQEGLDRREVVPATPGKPTARVFSCGVPLSGYTVTIVDDRRENTLPEGRIGEIAIKGPSTFEGYYKRPELNENAIVDGVYFSRDMGFMKDGELYVLGRKDDMLILYGRNFFAQEIEVILNDTAGIKPGRCGAFGVYSERMGTNELYALAELTDDGDAETAERDARARISEQLGVGLRRLFVVEKGALHKSTSGKQNRHLNRLILDKFLQGENIA
ncbi:fatty acyl-AMP ligase [Parvularcula flava]|uniref:Fatty acyl-AMP ligase n=1 Tax=Aquisalinus luteolus TaxID=1566827 RepID=A0A8J3A466_9PROT|nr:AMP-binding protein [Aquisalinus luteolus]NHK29516.1 fatty acyl-AMP ligase [Aquisalinus luteolus]GGI01702.1 hypothetical protein GCM10011355_32980 [Aquisalinus luteolus]